MKRKLLPNRRGVSTVMIASMFFLLLTFSTLALLLSGFFGYNLAVNEQMRIEQERAQEKVILTQLKLGDVANKTYITAVRVNNTGTITVKIRAIYETNTTMTIFLGDPSTWMDTYITPNDNLLIRGPPGPNETYYPITRFQPDAKLTLVTERGTKTSDYEGPVVYGSADKPKDYEPSRFYIGPLELMFTAFWYRGTTQDGGERTPPDTWHLGWSIEKSYGYIAWNLTVRNIDNKTTHLTLNTYSSFTLVPNEPSGGSSDERTWYLEPPPGQNEQILPYNETRYIIYKWTIPKGEQGFKAQSIYTHTCRCLVFLTFYGWFHWRDGTTTVYAQTIPFEAAITVI